MYIYIYIYICTHADRNGLTSAMQCVDCCPHDATGARAEGVDCKIDHDGDATTPCVDPTLLEIANRCNANATISDCTLHKFMGDAAAEIRTHPLSGIEYYVFRRGSAFQFTDVEGLNATYDGVEVAKNVSDNFVYSALYEVMLKAGEQQKQIDYFHLLEPL